MNKHAISIKWSDEDDGFIATIPGIGGLSAFGATHKQALQELETAAEAYFKELEKAGKPVPPKTKIIPYSGQTRLRMPKSLHAELASSAEEEGVSLNTYIITLLSEKHTAHKIFSKREPAEDYLRHIIREELSTYGKKNR